MSRFASLRLHAVAISFLALLTPIDFGAKLKQVSEEGSRTISGYAQSGVAVESVSPGGTAADYGFQANDVIFELNGRRTATPGDITDSLHQPDENNVFAFARAGKRRELVVRGMNPKRVALLTEQEYVDDKNNDFYKAAISSGLDCDMSTNLPRRLEEYSAIMIATRQGLNLQLAERLKKYVSSGGGVVLTGLSPARLAEEEVTSYRCDLSKVSDWVGASMMGASMEEKDQYLSAMTDKIPGKAVGKGERIFAFNGEGNFSWVLSPGELAVPLAQWSEAWDGRAIGALTNRFGEGRVYWQCLASHPNYPKLKTMLAEGIRWVSKLPGSGQ